MDVDPDQIAVRDNPAQARFETDVDGHLAFAAYRREGASIVFTHTQVPDELSGQGVGSKLVQVALDAARAQHLTVVPLCPFVRSFIQRHTAYQDLVDPQYLR